MNQVWHDLEKQEIPAAKLIARLRCGGGALTNWCHAQVLPKPLTYRLREGICFLRSHASWSGEEGVTKIELPVFHAGSTKFQQVGLLTAVAVDDDRDRDRDRDRTTISLEVVEAFADKTVMALRADILEMRIARA